MCEHPVHNLVGPGVFARTIAGQEQVIASLPNPANAAGRCVGGFKAGVNISTTVVEDVSIDPGSTRLELYIARRAVCDIARGIEIFRL